MLHWYLKVKKKKTDRKNKNSFQKWRSLLLLKVKCLFLTIVSHTLRITITVETPLMATSLQWPLFWRHSPYIDSCLNFSTEATSLQRLLSSVHKVAVVERFNCISVYSKILWLGGCILTDRCSMHLYVVPLFCGVYIVERQIF